MLTSEQPNVAKTGRYNTTRAAALGIHRNTLRLIPESELPRHQFQNGKACFIGWDLILYWRRQMR